MSDLEDAAAAHARRARQAAESAADNYTQLDRARQREAALLRERAREFFDYARRHAAPLFPLYLHGSTKHDGPYARIDGPCVTAAASDRGMFLGRYPVGQWAVSADGDVYYHARIEQRRRFFDAERDGIRDEVFVVVHMRRHNTVRNLSCDQVNPHFVAAAGALLDAVPVAGARATLTGVQGDGLIGYVL